jgi:tRNA-Thr(GGU) m(6)t(6)A37 methyltransferase TsaA
VNSDSNSSTEAELYQISPVGHIRRSQGRTFIQILDRYAAALTQLEQFGHVQVLWWFSEFDQMHYRQTTQCQPPYDAPRSGVFACRSPVRPNPIGLTTAMILSVDQDQGRVEIARIDAHDGTPVIDLKPYIPVCDRLRDVRVPDWMSDWPEWMPQEGLEIDD